MTRDEAIELVIRAELPPGSFIQMEGPNLTGEGAALVRKIHQEAKNFVDKLVALGVFKLDGVTPLEREIDQALGGIIEPRNLLNLLRSAGFRIVKDGWPKV